MVQLEAMRPLDINEQLDKALLLMGSDDASRARSLFCELRKRLSASCEPEKRFLASFADYWLAVIEGNPERATMACRRAEQIGYRGALRERFWVPPSEPQNSVDIDHAAILGHVIAATRQSH